MKKVNQQLLACLIVSAFIACNNSGADNATATSDTATTSGADNARAAIENENQKFVDEFRRGDSTALAAHYTSDAWAMPPNSEPVKGNDIAPLWGGAIRMGVKDAKLNTEDVSGTGDVVAETGTYEMYGNNNQVLDKGKYVVVWKKENGQWKIYRDIWNTSMPAASK